MRQTKVCGCLIASLVVDSEITRKKNKLKIEKINKKLKTVKDPKKIIKLKAEKKEIMKSLKEATNQKHTMKKHFDNFVKESGYVPPKNKHRKR